MDKKRKNDLPTPAPERVREFEGTEGRKKMRKTNTEELDFFTDGTDGRDKQLQDLAVKEVDHSEGNMKGKISPGAKRTKKPPKSLENFICRPSVRVFQRPEPVGRSVCKRRDGINSKTKRLSQLCHPVQKKCNTDSLETKDNSAMTNTDSSALSLSSLIPSSIISPASDSSTTRAAKKVLPKQTKKTDLKSDITLQETPQSSNKLSISHKITLNSNIKQTYSSKNPPDSNSTYQQESSPHECINVLNQDMKQKGQASPNSSYGNPSETSLHAVPSKLTSCFQKNASKYNESLSETPSSLHLNAKKSEGCVDDHNHADVRIATNDKSKHQNGSRQEPSPCTNDLLEHPKSFQVTDSPSSSKCTDTTSDLSENSRGSKGQNENKDLNCPPEITIKCPKNPVPEHKNYGNTNGSANDEHGKQVKLCTNQDQTEVDCLSDTNNSVSSTLNPQISTGPVTHVMDNLSSISKQDKKLSKKRQVRSLRSNKIVNEISHSPVASKLLDSGSQNETPFCSFSESLSSPQCEQNVVLQLTKSKLPQNSQNLNSEISSLNNPPFRKRGRPKSNKPGLQFETNNTQVSVINPPSDENPEDPEQELDMVQTRPMERKRGRPKQSFSTQAQETQSKLSSKKQCSGDLHTTSKDKARNIQKCKKSKRVIMKTIIGKINKMKVKRKDQMLTQILLGQKQCDTRDISHQGTERDACSPDSTATHSLSSLVSSFGGKLGSQINVSKRGTIYMGKRRGRKPKCQTTSNISFQKSPQMLPDNPHFTPMSTFVPSLDSQSIPLSGSHNTLKNIASSSSSGRCSQINFNAPKIKATSFKQLSENSQAHGELTLMCDSGEGINDNTTSDRSKRNNRLDEGMGFCSAPATGPVFTTSGVPGSNSFHGRQRALCALPPERLFSAHLPLGSGRPQDSNPSLTFTDQEAHKFKCHRKGHHCLSREKLRRHKYKCKKKYMHLKAKHQDPDFLADIDDLVVRLSKIRIVQRITRPKLGDDGNIIGRKTVKGKCQSYDLQCLQEKVHPPAMFQINLSGYYSPHSALSCEPLHYVRMANMRRKHGCASEPSEQIVTHFPVMHKLGYPYPGGGYIHPSYKVPVTTTSLGFGLCRGYPSSTLYPLPFPPSYLHHFSKNPIISPSKFHKKRTKFPRQDSAIWGQSAHGTYPRMTPHSSCDCFNTESGQRQKQKEKGKGRRDKHSMTERQHGNEEWLNKHTKANEISGNCSFNSPSPSLSPIFSQIQQKDKTFPFTRLNPSNLGQGGEVRRSEHQPPWGIGSRSLNHPFETLENNTVDHENTLKGPETEGNSTSAQQLHRRTQSFLKQPTLISGTSSQKRLAKSRRSEGLTGVSSVLREQVKTSVQELPSGDMRTPGINQAGGFPKKHQCSDPSLSREPEKIPRDPTGFKTKRRPLIKNKSNYARQTSSFLRDEQSHPEARNTPSTSSAKVQHFKASKHQNSEGLDFTDGNGVKRRGPGRPRKTPKPSSPSSPSLLSCPELASSLSIEKTGEDDKDNSDTVLEIIELVIQGEQRSGKKRKQDESVGDGEQNQNEEKDVTEHSSTLCHMCSEPIDPSPSQVEDSEPEQVTASLPNKKYLWAGLYSDVYKTEDIPDQPHQLNLEGLEYNPEEHEHGLFPAPLHVGKYLRVKRINFQLPYDIHWQYARNKLFEKPVTLPQASPSNSSCNPPNSSAPQSCSDDCFNTMLSDDETQSYDMDNHTHVHEEHHQCHHHLKQQEETSDNENFPTTLSSEERSFVMKHGVFLVRNYEKMKARQAFLLREGAREQEKEKDEDKANGQQSEGRSLGEDPTIKSDRCPIDRSSCAEEGEHITFQSRNLSHTLQEIWDRIVTCKGSSGQTLSDPLLNLCSRKRSDSALVDLSVVQKQLQSGCYESLAAFHSDMLTVFHCAEKYYGSESAVGRDVSQLRGLYHRAHQEASAHISNFL
ncbi:histone-lysine N-methyltransferase ASH1L-like isoform X2 [Tachysurus vachellii]|uniref:histone-lysine N-methyltransferase ASH1L-like isoform X2 n=1 Tax=Tachysurus vachellii TaxID=175792 RepID=UPI00296AB055|nr:histone-lysine N-methyltransferase ASH1L-like isoform X2 [Tachysurus vachellii]